MVGIKGLGLKAKVLMNKRKLAHIYKCVYIYIYMYLYVYIYIHTRARTSVLRAALMEVSGGAAWVETSSYRL